MSDLTWEDLEHSSSAEWDVDGFCVEIGCEVSQSGWEATVEIVLSRSRPLWSNVDGEWVKDTAPRAPWCALKMAEMAKTREDAKQRAEALAPLALAKAQFLRINEMASDGADGALGAVQAHCRE